MAHGKSMKTNTECQPCQPSLQAGLNYERDTYLLWLSLHGVSKTLGNYRQGEKFSIVSRKFYYTSIKQGRII